jgi:hypothetical protein
VGAEEGRSTRKKERKEKRRRRQKRARDQHETALVFVLITRHRHIQ